MNPSDFDTDKLSFGEIKTDQYGSGVDIKYTNNGKTGGLFLAMPLVRTDWKGVQARTGENNGRVSHSLRLFFPEHRPIMVEEPDEDGEMSGHYEEPDAVTEDGKLPPDDYAGDIYGNNYSETEELCAVFDKIYDKVIEYCIANKNKFGSFKQIPKIPTETMKSHIKHPIYRKMIPDSDIVDKSTPPSLYAGLIQSGPNGNPPNKTYTKFIGLDGKVIPHGDLADTVIYLSGTLKVERFYIGSSKTIQTKISSGIVHHVAPSNESSREMEKINEILAANPTAAKNFIRSFMKIKKEEQPVPNKQELPDTPPLESSSDNPEQPVESAKPDLKTFMNSSKTTKPARVLLKKSTTNT